MFADPQVITVSGVAQSMPRIMSEGQKSVYSKADGSYILTLSHQNVAGDRRRSMSRIDFNAVVPDPLTSVNDWEKLSWYSVLDRPLAGFTVAQVQALAAAHMALMTPTVVAQLFGGES